MQKMNNNHWEDYKIMSFGNQTKRYFLLHLNSLNTLRVKREDQFRIPSVWLIFIVLDVEKTIRSIVEHFGDDERAFPRRSDLVWFLLVHSKNQVPFLKCPTLTFLAWNRRRSC